MQRRFLLALFPLVALAGVASGCGGGSSNASATAAATASTTTSTGELTAAEKALFTYAACMRGKGVKIPDPIPGANGGYAFPRIPAKVTGAAGVRAKAQACAAKLPQGTFRRGGTPSAKQRAAFQKFSACMRANGVTLAAPGGRQGGQDGPPGPVQVTPGPQPGQAPRQGQAPGAGGFYNSNDPKVKAALAKCQKLRPAGFTGRRAP